MKKIFLLFLVLCSHCYCATLDLFLINKCVSDCSVQNGGLDHILIVFPPDAGEYTCVCKNGYEKSYRANAK